MNTHDLDRLLISTVTVHMGEIPESVEEGMRMIDSGIDRIGMLLSPDDFNL